MRGVERLRAANPPINFTSELETELKKHFERFAESRSFTLTRRAKLSGLTVIAFVVIAGYVYAFLGTAWSDAEVLWRTLGFLIGSGCVLLGWLAVSKTVIQSEILEALSYIAIPAIVSSGAMIPLHYAPRWFDDTGMATATREAAAGAILAPAMLVVLGTVLALISRPFSADFKIPDSTAVVSLSEALILCMKNTTWTLLGEDKRNAIAQLERAASALERGFPAILKPLDLMTEVWLREQCVYLASSVRELKRWLITPKPETRQALRETLSLFVSESAVGNWDALRLDGIEPIQASSAIRHLLGTVRSLVAGIAPLGVSLFLLQQKVLTGPMSTPTLILTGALALIVVLKVVDPQSLDQLARARDAARGTSFTRH